jgi:chemotaxis family two-component system response regulator Rcp1
MQVIPQNQNRSVVILLAEDNLTDAFLIQEALKHSKYPIHLGVVHNGEEALHVLHHEGRNHSLEDPDLLVVDLNLSKINGWKVLEAVKQDPALSRLPVLLVTSSWKKEDEERAHELKADCYLVKPLDTAHFPMLLQAVERLLAA